MNKTIKAYILDDEQDARERLTYIIESFFKDKIEIAGQGCDPVKGLTEILEVKPEMLLLDVEMPGMTGLELANKLQNAGYKGKIVFITAFDHYAIKAIRAKAYDYFLKPVDIDTLKSVVERFMCDRDKLFNPKVIEKYGLSEREIELITLLSRGLSSEEIASEMFLSKHTVDTHRRNILMKTSTRNSIELLNLLSS